MSIQKIKSVVKTGERKYLDFILKTLPRLNRLACSNFVAALVVQSSAEQPLASWCRSPRRCSLLPGSRRLAVDVVTYNRTKHPQLSHLSHENARVLFADAYEDQICVVNRSREAYVNKLSRGNGVAAGDWSSNYTLSRSLLERTPLSTSILFKGNNGCTGAVSTIFPGRQQTRLPEEDFGQQPRGQASVQLVPESVEEALASPVRTPLLFVLFQQNCEVSRVVARQLARWVARARGRPEPRPQPSGSPRCALRVAAGTAACDRADTSDK